MSEEDATAKFGDKNINVYHSHFNPLEFVIPKRDDNKCYAKLICVQSEGVSSGFVYFSWFV
jgi:hypothetical protein